VRSFVSVSFWPPPTPILDLRRRSQSDGEREPLLSKRQSPSVTIVRSLHYDEMPLRLANLLLLQKQCSIPWWRPESSSECGMRSSSPSSSSSAPRLETPAYLFVYGGRNHKEKPHRGAFRAGGLGPHRLRRSSSSVLPCSREDDSSFGSEILKDDGFDYSSAREWEKFYCRNNQEEESIIEWHSSISHDIISDLVADAVVVSSRKSARETSA